ncbi:MAG: PQ-loop domain-containing transporter [Ilumatobacteraceae bacterium]
MTLANLSGAMAAVLGVVFIWPQVIRVYVRRSVEGVSGLSHLIGLAGTLMWFTYAVSIDSVPMIVSNLNIEIAIVALMVMLVRQRALPLWMPLAVFAATAVFCATFYVVSPAVVGVAGVVIGTPAIIPQAWRALKAERLYGVSAPSYLLLALMGSGWFLHGYFIDDFVVGYPNLILIPCALLIAWKSWMSHHESSEELATLTNQV